MASEVHHHHHQRASCRGVGGGEVAPPRRHFACPVALQLLHQPLTDTEIDLAASAASPRLGWERCLELKTGKIFYRRTGMSRRPRLELKLNLSPPRPMGGPPAAGEVVRDELENGSSASGSSSPVSLPSSCVSSETEEGERSPEATAAMVLAGCARCFMYVMVAEEEPKCPKCKSVVLLDFLEDNSEKKKK